MASIALADVLPDFGIDVAPALRRRESDDAEKQPGAEAADYAAPTLAFSADAEPAAPTAEQLERQHEAALEQERAKHAEEVEALRARLGEQTGATVAKHFAEMEQRILDLTAASAARILSVTMTDELQKRSIESLTGILRDALGDREAVRVRVRGAPALFEELKKALGERAGHLEFTEDSGFDLTVTIDETVFETRLAEWSAVLAEALP